MMSFVLCPMYFTSYMGRNVLLYLPILQPSVAAVLDGNLVTQCLCMQLNLYFCFDSSQTNRQIRLNELLKEHSSTANLIVM